MSVLTAAYFPALAKGILGKGALFEALILEDGGLAGLTGCTESQFIGGSVVLLDTEPTVASVSA